MKSIFQKMIVTCFVLLIFWPLKAQTSDFDVSKYRALNPPEGRYTAGKVMARMFDGLGYRYYWATLDLTDRDMQYKPSKEARSVIETMEHIYDLCASVERVFMDSVVDDVSRNRPKSPALLRRQTMEKISNSSLIVAQLSEKDLENLSIRFERASSVVEFPLWYLINGQISDAIYHVGQLVSFRRTAGNPIHPNLSMFRGKLMKE